jgi:hypothetical protein
MFYSGRKGQMNEIIIPSLYLLAGIMTYASAHHFTYAIRPPRDRMQMLFAGICLLLASFIILLAGTYQADSLIEFIWFLRRNIAGILLFFSLFPWFIALFTGIRPKPLLVSLNLLFAVLFVVNLVQPYSLQYDHIDGLRAMQLPWGETITVGDGHSSPWLYIASLGVIATFGYALYALGSVYYRYRRRTDLWMLFATGLFFIGAIEGILVRIPASGFISFGTSVSNWSRNNPAPRFVRTGEPAICRARP